MRNKLILSVLLIFVVLISASAVLAQSAKKASINDIVKILEKCTKDASFTTDIISKIGGKEYLSKTTYFFKDNQNFRIDSEAQNQKTTVIVTPKESWTINEIQKTIEPLPAEAAKQMDLVANLKNVGKGAAATKIKDGEYMKYMINNKKTKLQHVYFIDEKTKTIVKQQMINESIQMTTETIYKDYKFGKIDEKLLEKPDFNKPAEASAVPAPAAPVDATAEVKVDAPAAPAATGEVKVN